MSDSRHRFLFVGPTLAPLHGDTAIDEALSSFTVLPPAVRNDIHHLVTTHPPGLIGLVDGVLHHQLSVGHRELQDAIRCGWRIIGLSSIGAIRAYELRHHGMIGFGSIYQRFTSNYDFQDDEVALLHEPTPPYRWHSEPMVHLRYAVESWHLSPHVATAIIHALKALWFGERTLQRFREIVTQHTPHHERPHTIYTLPHWSQYRVKCHDLRTFLLTQET